MSITGIFGSAGATSAVQFVKVIASGVRSANGSILNSNIVGGWPRPEMSCILPANSLNAGGYFRVNYEFSNSGTGSLFYTQLAGKPIGATYSISGNSSYRGSLFMRYVGGGQIVATTGASDGTQSPLTSLSCDLSIDQMFQIYSNGPIILNAWSVEACNATATAAPAGILPGRKLFYGINAHIDEGNGPPIATRISAMKALGFNVLRVSWFGTTHSSGGVLATTWIQDMASAFAADSGSLGLNMMVMVSCGPGVGTEADAYSAGFAQGVNAATLLGSKGVQLYELGNEVDADTRIRRITTTQGTVVDDYSLSSTVAWATWRGSMRGCYDGIKSIQPTAQVGSNAFTNASMWASDALWNGVDPQGNTNNPQVRWDWTNWHTYTEDDMTNIDWAPSNPKFNLLQHLHNAYQRPIFITEYNPAEATTASTNAHTTAWMTTWYSAQATYNIGGLVWFSWFDGIYAIAGTATPATVNSMGQTLIDFISAHPALK